MQRRTLTGDERNQIEAVVRQRRGNCHDNAVAESFSQLLKRERIRRQIYTTRAQARSDVFDYIEMFYNPTRRHGYTNQLSPVEFERQYFLNNRSV